VFVAHTVHPSKRPASKAVFAPLLWVVGVSGFSTTLLRSGSKSKRVVPESLETEGPRPPLCAPSDLE